MFKDMTDTRLSLIMSILSFIILVSLACIVGLHIIDSDSDSESDDDESCDDMDVYTYDSGVSGPKIGIIGGVHGNEPAGSVAINKILNQLYGAGGTSSIISRGSLVLIPDANKCGLRDGTRYQPGVPRHLADINRNFGESGIFESQKARRIVKSFIACDLILDFHEGWGWYRDNNASIGSSLSPSGDQFVTDIATQSCENINKMMNITEWRKQFQVRDEESCDIPSTLRCYMDKHDKNYILIEVTGQDNIQPLSMRAAQCMIVIMTAINMMGLA